MSQKHIQKYPPIAQEKAPSNILDKSDPRSLYSLSPPSVKQAMDRLHPDDLIKSEDELIKEFKPNRLHCAVRVSFWAEYDRVQAELEDEMSLTAICKRIVDPHHFRKLIATDWYIKFLVTPPMDYSVATQEALMFGIHRLREILELPLYKENGDVNGAIVDKIIRTVAFLDLRVKGGITQRHEVKQLNFNLHADAGKVEADMVEMAPQDIEKRLEKLRAKQAKYDEQIKEALPPPPPPEPPFEPYKGVDINKLRSQALEPIVLPREE